MPKNPRRLSDFEANLSRLERRKSKAWSGEGLGIAEDCGEGEGGGGGGGEGEGVRRKSDAEELKLLVVGKLRRVSLCRILVFDVAGGDADGCAFLVVQILVQSVALETLEALRDSCIDVESTVDEGYVL